MEGKIQKVGLDVAPWLFVAWLVANFASCLYPPLDGFCRYLPLGPMKIDTWLTAIPTCGLFLLWLQKKMPMPIVWYWASITMGLLVCTAMSVLENPNRAMRMITLITGQGIG